MSQHISRVAGGEVAGLCMEIQKDGIGIPSTEGLDSSFVYSGHKEGSGAPGTEAVGNNAVWRNVCEVLH